MKFKTVFPSLIILLLFLVACTNSQKADSTQPASNDEDGKFFEFVRVYWPEEIKDVLCEADVSGLFAYEVNIKKVPKNGKLTCGMFVEGKSVIPGTPFQEGVRLKEPSDLTPKIKKMYDGKKEAGTSIYGRYDTKEDHVFTFCCNMKELDIRESMHQENYDECQERTLKSLCVS